jgi:hypothetical protein
MLVLGGIYATATGDPVAKYADRIKGLRKEIDTFEKRAIVADLLMGEKLGGALRGGSIIPGGKIMMETTEPMLQGVDTFSIGPRLFTLDRGVTTRPDLHPAFPEILQGEDLRQLFVPVPNEIALPTFNEEFRRRTGRKKPGYYDLTMTHPGEPYPTQDITEKYLTHLQKEGYADGGVVHMQGGGSPGEVSGDMFRPKPLEIPSMFTDAAAKLKAQFEKERRSMRKPGAAQDVLMRGPVAFSMGAPMDIIGMGGEALDYLQTKIPGLRDRASVMDTGPERVPTMGYAPKVSMAPEGPYGTEAAQDLLKRAGLTTGEERPLFELGSGITAPIVGATALKAGKALAPTAGEMLEAGLERALEPMRMYAVPPGKSGKVKAPANPVGFYNPAEKAALNLQRKQGPGSAFISDMKKLEQGVNDERIAELGLNQLAARPSVTREEVMELAEQNRIPLRESVSREKFNDELLEELASQKTFIAGGIQKIEKDLEVARQRNQPALVAQFETKIGQLQDAMRKVDERMANNKPAMFGPEAYPDYSTPGGENYREIRVGLPAKESPKMDVSGYTVQTLDENNYTGQRAIRILDQNGKMVTQRSGFRGTDQQALDELARDTARSESRGLNYLHQTHHGDEPNVLFHLRVADHTDAEGKRGLLIDELQSDWHQTGREKGYRLPSEVTAPMDSEYRALVHKNREAVEAGKAPDPKDVARAQFLEQELIRSDGSKIPNAPFKDNWYQLGLKRAIKEAADTGMDRVYLTTGARQADRYNLSEHVDELVAYEDNTLVARKDGRNVIQRPFNDESELANMVGKDVAKKLLETKPDMNNQRILSGQALKVGGEGMRQYYDKTYKNFLDKYAKQFGGRLGETTLKGTREEWPFPITIKKEGDGYRLFGRDPRTDSFNDNLAGKSFDSLEEAEKARDNFYAGSVEKVYYIDITDAMRDSAKKGQSYKDGGAVKMAEGGEVDYTDAFNRLLQQHFSGMAEGGAVDYEEKFNKMLQSHIQGMADGGEVNAYSADPDISERGLFVPAPAFANGGAVKSIWTVN